MSGGMWSRGLREDLAASEHDQWRAWVSYMLSHMTLENVLRWLRQSRTDYADLSPAEQRSDRQFVERTLDILERHGVVVLPDHPMRRCAAPVPADPGHDAQWEVHLILERVMEMTRACPLGMRCRECPGRLSRGDPVCGMAKIHTLACELVGRRRG
ncbi:MAG: hypothetical protein PHH53_03120 [Candidatus Nanoarchaeia archaeon]|nr:hypothetical protein [Candidatus Nanoarchaeia archaeon]